MSEVKLKKHFVCEYELTDNPKDEDWMIDGYVYIAEDVDAVIEKLQAKIDELGEHENIQQKAAFGMTINQIQVEGIREMKRHSLIRIFQGDHWVSLNDIEEFEGKLERKDES